jgi:predicted Rossmann-fold nucleotide-binding protein
MSTQYPVVDSLVSPQGRLDILSRNEITRVLDNSQTGLYPVFRNCSLAVLSSGSQLDDSKALLERYPDFDIRILHRERGIKLELRNAPASAFVDGVMIQGIREHLFAVLRDILFINAGAPEPVVQRAEDSGDSAAITDFVFHILRNADVLRPERSPNLVVCWGGHSISRVEYDYTKRVGYELGLRALDICTGCGPGAMKGPMKGATIGHAKQRISDGRYLGFSEPGIIAAEAPNPIVNNLVVLPDIEKRLEAFVRTGHAIIVFPGGAGTAEEILYLLGILLHPDNRDLQLPVIFTGPEESAAYFTMIDEFVGATLGPSAQERYQVIIDDPAAVALAALRGIEAVRGYRKQHSDAYYFNWRMKIDAGFQRPFEPTHEAMRSLALRRDQPTHELAAHLRRAFSGIVAGNVKLKGIAAVEKHGLFEIRGESEVMLQMDRLLSAFVEQGRMKLPGSHYQPCYRIVR